MRFSFFPIFLLLSTFSFAQQLSIDKGTTRALVVGVSDYEDNRLEDLNFAHRDAEIFADYLKSNAGGNVDSGNIVLLTNKNATQARINEEMRKLRENAQEGDLVIFYFSGHGDKETGMKTELGYLLAHDTPVNNYRGNAIDLYYLNADAYELSEGKKAKFVIILDACHSGQLAGDDVDGRVNLSENAKLPSGSEIRILSCQSDQKSLEVADLDGGRGLFSYYLVRGLIGEAEEDKDLQVTKDELEGYLKKNINREAKKRDKKQYPIITGEYDFRLSFVDEEALAALKSQDENSTSDGDLLAVVERGVEKSLANLTDTEEQVDYLYEPFDKAVYANLLLFPENKSAFYFYTLLLKESPNDERLPELKSRLIVALQDQAQKAINAYLRGDQNELDRRFYITKSQDYRRFPAYLEKAAELVGTDYPTYKGIKAKQFYFEGINARLEAAKTGLTKESLKNALTMQKKALEYEANAAYIHNEFGVIYFNLNDLKKAQEKFDKAIELAPTWAIPYYNLCELHLEKKEIEQAKKWAQKAIDLQPDLLNPNIKMGYIYETQKNYLKAEEYYRAALKLNWEHYSSFEQLAYIYTLMGDYALADHLFLEADIRKKDVFPPLVGLNQPISDFPEINRPRGDLLSLQMKDEKALLDEIAQNPYNYIAWYELGGLYLSSNRLEEAEECFKKVIFIEPEFLEARNALGDLYIILERYHEALAIFSPLLEKDSTLARKVWELLEKVKRYDEVEELIKKYGDEHELYHFYSIMIHNFPKHMEYFMKRGSMLYEAKERGDTLREYEYINYSFDGFSGDGYLVDYRLFYGKDEYWGRYVIADFEKVIELEPDHPEKFDIYLKLGGLYQELSSFYESDVFVVHRVREYASDRTQYNIYHGFLERIQKAIEYSEKAYELTDSIVVLTPTFQLINQYLINFEHEKALALLETLVANYRLDFENRQKLIRIYTLTNQLKKAGAMLVWTFERPFGSVENTNVIRGMHYRLNDEYLKAIESYKKAMEPIVISYDIRSKKETIILPEKRHYYQYEIATLYALNGDKKASLEALEEAIKLGFFYPKVLAYDPDIKSIRSSKRFKKLIAQYHLENKTVL